MLEWLVLLVIVGFPIIALAVLTIDPAGLTSQWHSVKRSIRIRRPRKY